MSAADDLDAVQRDIKAAVEGMRASNARIQAMVEHMQWEITHNGDGPMSEFLPVLLAADPDELQRIGVVDDAGGGVVSVVVDRDLAFYPALGTVVYVPRAGLGTSAFDSAFTPTESGGDERIRTAE